MNNQIYQMAKTLYESLSPLNKIRGIAWGDLMAHDQLPWVNAVKAALKSSWLDVEHHGEPEPAKNVWLFVDDMRVIRGHLHHDDEFYDEQGNHIDCVVMSHWAPIIEPPAPK